MTTYMRKSLALATYQPTTVHSNLGYVASDFPATRTSYVRMWVDWRLLAPYGPNEPANDNRPLPWPNHATTIQQYVWDLDAQIRYARSNGLRVILTFDLFPGWANGRPTNDIQDYYHYPQDLSATSWWARYLKWCMSRWSSQNPANGGVYADHIEICNEPNTLFRPAANSHVPVGKMMFAAQQVRAELGLTTPIILAPAVADVETTTSTQTAAVKFTRELMGYLNYFGFRAGTTFGFSAHNYKDIKYGGSRRAQEIRQALTDNYWRGWPYADPARTYVLHTEGGSFHNEAGDFGQAYQIDAAYKAWENDGTGAGLGMFTQYLDISDQRFDTGIRSWVSPYNTRQSYTIWGACDPY